MNKTEEQFSALENFIDDWGDYFEKKNVKLQKNEFPEKNFKKIYPVFLFNHKCFSENVILKFILL